MKFETLCFGYGLIEGPREDAEGGLHFSDVTQGGVYRRAPDGTISTVVPRRRGVGGIALHAEGGLVISGRNVCHVKGGNTRVVLAREDSLGFNDLFTDAAGRVFVGSLRSDPFATTGARIPGALYRIELDGTVTELYGDVGLTNGIGLSPDGRTLYHSDTAAAAILAHDLGDDGKATNRRWFARVDGMPDGLAVDTEGGVWVAVYGGSCVQRFAADGRPERRIEVPAQNVTSLCFGGADHRDLYVVTADNTEDPQRKGTVFRARSDVAGVAVAPARV